MHTNVEIRSLAQGREMGVARLYGCCAHRATKQSIAERTGVVLSTELDDPTPREERYRGGGTNGVYDLFYTRSTDRQRSIPSKVWVRL